MASPVLAWILVGAGAHAVTLASSVFPDASRLRSMWMPLALLVALVIAALGHRAGPCVALACSLALVAIAVDAGVQLARGTSLLGQPLYAQNRISGPLPHPNDLALVPVLLVFARPWAWLVALPVVIVSRCRNALFGLGALLWSKTRGPVRWLLLGGLLGGVATLWAFGDVGPFDRGVGRIGIWAVAWRMFTEAPWLGKGAFTFAEHYQVYLPEVHLPFGAKAEVSYIPWAHSLYLEQLAERGLLGLAVFAAPLLWAWRSSGPQVRTAIAVLLVEGVFDLSFIKPWVLVTYWGLIGLAGAEA